MEPWYDFYFDLIFLEDIKADISKSNTLRQAANEKQESLEKLYKKEKKLVEKKNELAY